MKKNILAIDLGKHTCGLAISRSGIFSTPLKSFKIENNDYLPLVNHLKELSQVEKIETIVLGYPLFPSGDKCEMTLVVEEFSHELKKEFIGINIQYQDERNSTVDASEILQSIGKNSKKQKEIIDSTSACVILDRYLKKVNND